MTENEFFNLKKLRKNWVEESSESRHVGHAKLSAVKPTLDPLTESARIIEELDQQCKIRFPRHYESISVFLSEARTSFQTLFGQESEDVDEARDDSDDDTDLHENEEASSDTENEESNGEEVDADELRSLQANLLFLEDLLEALAL